MPTTETKLDPGHSLRSATAEPGGNSDGAGRYYCWPPKAAR